MDILFLENRDNNWLPTPVEQEKQRADLAEAELAK